MDFQIVKSSSSSSYTLTLSDTDLIIMKRSMAVDIHNKLVNIMVDDIIENHKEEIIESIDFSKLAKDIETKLLANLTLKDKEDI